jgi:hypothetical protein
VSDSDPKPPDDRSGSGAVPGEVPAEHAQPTQQPESPGSLPRTELEPSTSGSIDVQLSGPLPRAELEPSTSGSIDVQLSGPLPRAELEPSESGSVDVQLSGPLPRAADDEAVPTAAPELDSAPVSSGRVTAMAVAATGPTETARARLTEASKEMLGKGVETLGSGVEAIGGGVTKLAEASRRVPLVGASVAKLGEGITSVGESITDLPRVARTRRGRLLVRSLVVGFLLVAVWIVGIVLLQTRRTDAPDFRPHAERILGEISQGRAAIEELYEKSSPRFQEMVQKDRFVDDMLDLNATVGKFLEITAINESIVTRGPTGRIGRVSLTAEYARGLTRASVSLHWDDRQWKLLGVGVEVPPDVKITEAEREVRVAACCEPNDPSRCYPMDPKRCDLNAAASAILVQLSRGEAAAVWAAASDVFQKQEQQGRWVAIQKEHRSVLGEYRRIIAVTEAKVFGGNRAWYDVLVEYERATVRAAFGFSRGAKADPWQLGSLKIVLPMPRIDDAVPVPE